MGHCVRPSVRPSVFSHFGGDSCITAPAQLIATAFVVFFVRPSVRRSVRPSVRNPLLCERFLHLRSCPIARDWCCCVYGTPHCPCPTHYCPCPTPATNAAMYLALFSFCAWKSNALWRIFWQVISFDNSAILAELELPLVTPPEVLINCTSLLRHIEYDKMKKKCFFGYLHGLGSKKWIGKWKKDFDQFWPFWAIWNPLVDPTGALALNQLYNTSYTRKV